MFNKKRRGPALFYVVHEDANAVRFRHVVTRVRPQAALGALILIHIIVGNLALSRVRAVRAPGSRRCRGASIELHGAQFAPPPTSLLKEIVRVSPLLKRYVSEADVQLWNTISAVPT